MGPFWRHLHSQNMARSLQTHRPSLLSGSGGVIRRVGTGWLIKLLIVIYSKQYPKEMGETEEEVCWASWLPRGLPRRRRGIGAGRRICCFSAGYWQRPFRGDRGCSGEEASALASGVESGGGAAPTGPLGSRRLISRPGRIRDFPG